MLRLVWVRLFKGCTKRLPILGTMSGKTVKLMLLALICLGNSREDFFFFQAEDGIRDRDVTGVQTCALPISGTELVASIDVDAVRAMFGNPTTPKSGDFYCVGAAFGRFFAGEDARFPGPGGIARSEERRVGKGWGSGGARGGG